MNQHNYKIDGIEGLNAILQSEEIKAATQFNSHLVQLYSAHNDFGWYQTLGNAIKQSIPDAIIVGASSVGEINEGKIHTNSTVILFSFFESAGVTLSSYKCQSGNEEIIGAQLLDTIRSIKQPIKGILLLSTPITNDSGKIFNIVTNENPAIPLFGGGAGDYANKRKTLIFDGINCFEEGIITVIFTGESLHFEVLSHLGWLPLSKEMTITETGPVSVKTIDHMPAFSVYKKYLGIKSDSNFFQNSLEFPFLINRNNNLIARTPFFVNEEDGSIQLVAEVEEGEKFRIGYGNPQLILEESVKLQHQMRDFKPEAIYLYTCICRRFLMQDEVDLETIPFNEIAPTAGFYTFGEFCTNSKINSLLNSSLVTVGIREGESKNEQAAAKKTIAHVKKHDPYIKQHNRILSRLLYFIDELKKEQEEQNQKLQLLNDQKNEFLGIAAHDLRNPIGNIRGFAEFIEENVTAENKKYANIIISECSKMVNLLNDLLDISKIESGKSDHKNEQVDYISMVTQAIHLNSQFAKKKQITISGDYEMNHQLLYIDPEKIEQVLNNLISNAIKYSYPKSTILVNVKTTPYTIITTIQDQGVGIPQNEIKDIFQPFKKSSIKPTGGESSHGLGLAIVKRIVEAHGGEVGVRSEPGVGSQFYFSLPVKS